MGKIVADASKHIDEYIAEMEPFAQEICNRLRAIIHKAEPGIIEDWKWGPNFNKDGMVCGFGAFKKHVSLAFFQGALLSDPHQVLLPSTNEHNRMIKFTHTDQINEELLISYIREAVANNEQGQKAQPKPKTIETPKDFEALLAEHSTARQFYEQLSYVYKKDFVEWIEGAKHEATRHKRMHKAIKMLTEGIRLNDKYMTKANAGG